jgi:hypothetical protein
MAGFGRFRRFGRFVLGGALGGHGVGV